MKRYPNAQEAVVAALAMPIPAWEAEAVKDLLSAGKSVRTPYQLVEFGKAFAAKFLKQEIRVEYAAGGPTDFHHVKRRVRLGKPEMVRLLHEIGHARYGPYEDKAVAYSLGLLMKADPAFVPVLEGHVLQNDPY